MRKHQGRKFGEVRASTMFAGWKISTVQGGRESMPDLNEIKITPRDEQVLKLLVQGCSNKEIAEQLNISPRTVKQHLRTLFLRAGIRDGRKRVKLATAMFQREQAQSCSLVNA
jgi:DNA-binding NarL/FixJ family response regulator